MSASDLKEQLIFVGCNYVIPGGEPEKKKEKAGPEEPQTTFQDRCVGEYRQ